MKYNSRDIAMVQSYDRETGQLEVGDIMLSAPLHDMNGNEKPNTVDIYTCMGYENLKQMISIRFMTQKGDYSLRPGLGQTLNRIMGRRITKELIAEGQQYIVQTITFDNFIAASDIDVTGIPFDRQTILYNIAINVGANNYYKFNMLYDSEQGTWRIE
jgi:hypothetical protein